MRVGTLCYATDQGLGVLARAFHTHGVVTHPYVVVHSHHPTHTEWHRGAPSAHIRQLNVDDIVSYFKQCDAVLFFETPFVWALLPALKAAGVLTALMPMHECMPAEWPHQPDVVLNPSHLDQRCFPRGVHIPVPVEVEWRKRDRARVFVHNAGHGGLRGRNGTKELLEAIRYLKSDAEFIIRSQDPNWREWKGWRGVDIRVGTAPWNTLYAEGDVFLFPEKFNGLSLPLQEAFASGMPCMATDRFPMDQWLPRNLLIQPTGEAPARIGPSYREFMEAHVDPKAIAAKIDAWYDADISEYSELGRKFAERNSWAALKPKYLEALGCA